MENPLIPFGRAWWKEAVVYQIYPISFFDSNGDGIGDLNGIASKLDYLKDLGVDVLWLSPIYKSPLADMGYDISDYQDIDPRYGTLEDWDNLLKGVHDRGMKLIMDLVVNHSSDQHEWFLQSKSSKSNPKRDWYIWRPPKYDSSGNRQPPNNWKAVFQGSAWEFDETTQEYYLHLYLPQQPDLNWDNPEMDVINIISKTDGLPDAPIIAPGEPYQPAGTLFANGPRVHEYIKEMNTKVLSKYDILTVGETPFTHDASHLARYVLPANKELNMVFQFEHMELDTPLMGDDDVPLLYKSWKLTQMKEIITRWQQYKRDEGFWNAAYTENHDHARSVSRFGNDSDQWRALSAKLLGMLQVMQGGTQFVYQGQELGLKNFPRSWGLEEYKDIATQNFWSKTLNQRKASSDGPVDMEDVLDNFAKKARDHARVPMQWDLSPNAGFTRGTPWMRVNEDYQTWNAQSQTGDDTSVFAFWKRLLKLRKGNQTLIYGTFEDVSEGSEKVFGFVRALGDSWYYVVLNFGEEEITFTPKDGQGRAWSALKVVLGNYDEAPTLKANDGTAHLRGWEAVCYEA
ncbi:alpha-glucosidase [Coprinopsis cinerea okayama7|uniref:Alpha-glucosidase n=1 Tax=Coprinopsis cinerea (strain Okayama-7 / 130 / ATCC MYA-4618 / FGSC 9003) TaxID=240176 RepID=A8MZY4_COPC7|nr:alpha-glucosidase [Coprinopsis cinerea okayama7\|eukprot:XP_001828299.1 alpha-glucosidase [Coprinopsis cinerea okayama7\